MVLIISPLQLCILQWAIIEFPFLAKSIQKLSRMWERNYNTLR